MVRGVRSLQIGRTKPRAHARRHFQVELEPLLFVVQNLKALRSIRITITSKDIRYLLVYMLGVSREFQASRVEEILFPLKVLQHIEIGMLENRIDEIAERFRLWGTFIHVNDHPFRAIKVAFPPE